MTKHNLAIIPGDGILKISTTWSQDQQLRKILDKKIVLNKPFNGRRYNCCDFVIEVLENQFGFSFKAKEFIGLGWSSTPNKLYRSMKDTPGFMIIKDAGNKMNGTFFGQRVIYKLFNKKRSMLSIRSKFDKKTKILMDELKKQ